MKKVRFREEQMVKNADPVHESLFRLADAYESMRNRLNRERQD